MKRIFGIKPRLRLWQQRRRKKQREQNEIDNEYSYALRRQWYSHGDLSLIIPLKPCGQSDCDCLREYREQCYLRGVEVRYTVNLCSKDEVRCDDCYLKQESEQMKAQEEQMMQQAMQTEPDNAKWIVRSQLLKVLDDSSSQVPSSD